MSVPVAIFISDFWNDQLVAHDRQWLFLVLVGLVDLVRLHPALDRG